MVSIPNTDAHTTPVDYGPITLRNTDYKILARIIANRLRPTLSDPLNPSQYCGVPGSTIFDALVTVRDATAYAELTHTPLCILSLGITAASDRFAHACLFRMLKSYGFSMRFNTLIREIYDQAFSVQING